MTTPPVDPVAPPTQDARYECMDCGHAGPDVERRSHAATQGCHNFRTTTTRVSAYGAFIDRRIEVCQC